MHSDHGQSTQNARKNNHISLSGEPHPLNSEDERRFWAVPERGPRETNVMQSYEDAKALVRLHRALSALPQDLLRTLQRAADSLDLDVDGLTADQVVQRYSAFGWQITLDLAARLLRETSAPISGDGNVSATQLNKSDLPITADKDEGANSHQGSVAKGIQLAEPDDLHLKSPEEFWSQWSNLELDAPFVSCSIRQAYSVYLQWCSHTGERYPYKQSQFASLVLRYANTQGEMVRLEIMQVELEDGRHKYVRMLLLGEPFIEPGESQKDWAKATIARFDQYAPSLSNALSAELGSRIKSLQEM